MKLRGDEEWKMEMKESGGDFLRGRWWGKGRPVETLPLAARADVAFGSFFTQQVAVPDATFIENPKPRIRFLNLS